MLIKCRNILSVHHKISLCIMKWKSLYEVRTYLSIIPTMKVTNESKTTLKIQSNGLLSLENQTFT